MTFALFTYLVFVFQFGVPEMTVFGGLFFDIFPYPHFWAFRISLLPLRLSFLLSYPNFKDTPRPRDFIVWLWSFVAAVPLYIFFRDQGSLVFPYSRCCFASWLP